MSATQTEPKSRRFDAFMQNSYGEWVPAIPLAYRGWRYECECGEKFWTETRYREHFALHHILDPAEPQP